MTTTTQTIDTEDVGVYSTCKYKSKVCDNTFKTVSLSPLNKKSTNKEVCLEFMNWDDVPEYTEDTNWWSSKVLNNWDMLFYKPIKVLEKIEITGTPGLGKIISKEKFWLKKVLIKSPITRHTRKRFFTHKIYVSFAISQGEKNGVYTLIDKDNCNTDGDCYARNDVGWYINENLIKHHRDIRDHSNFVKECFHPGKFTDERDIKYVNNQHNSFKAFCNGTRIAQRWGKIKYIDI